MKKINRNILRGTPLDELCKKARTTTKECGEFDNRVFCYGLIDPMFDEPLEMCKACNAYVINAPQMDIVKTHPKYLLAAIRGEKTFTVRKNDRDYEVGEIIRKMGYTPLKGYTGEYADFLITYILTHDDFPDGIKKGYVVCGIKLISK